MHIYNYSYLWLYMCIITYIYIYTFSYKHIFGFPKVFWIIFFIWIQALKCFFCAEGKNTVIDDDDNPEFSLAEEESGKETIKPKSN